jgi:hypothetical protein
MTCAVLRKSSLGVVAADVLSSERRNPQELPHLLASRTRLLSRFWWGYNDNKQLSTR